MTRGNPKKAIGYWYTECVIGYGWIVYRPDGTYHKKYAWSFKAERFCKSKNQVEAELKAKAGEQ